MITKENLDGLRLNLSVKSRNGLDFILSGCIIWLIIGFIWTLDYSSYDNSVLTFFAGGLMLPLAFLFSKLFKTVWTNKDNPLQPLGLWLNFAQLLYSPFLIFILLKMPDYFVMVYAIITGAHFFPYAWFYNTNLYAIFAGIISLGSLLLGLSVSKADMYFIPLSVSALLFILAILLYFDSKRRAGLMDIND